MNIWLIGICALLLAAAVLSVRLLLLRRAIREIAEGLTERLDTETNTPIGISSGDAAIRALTAKINVQLRALRKERLRLQHGDAELKSAITNISHDLRTPLTAISGYLELLEHEEHTERARGYLAVLRERTDTMRSLSEELLRYSVACTAAETLRREPVRLNDLLEQSLAGMYALLSARGIVPEIRMPGESVVRLLDAEALRRVFDNILNNAARYAEGDLAVSLTREGELCFCNSSKKLDRVQTGRIFDRFFTVESASGSTGLGLSIARLLTEKMGGSISAAYVSGKLWITLRFPE